MGNLTQRMDEKQDSTETRLVEINGQKFALEYRTAVRVDTLRVGDRVRVLVKEGYSAKSAVKSGVIVGFEPFAALPSIVVAYLSADLTSAEVKFVTFNSETKDVEIVKAVEGEESEFDREHAIKMLDRDILKATDALTVARQRRQYFLDHFRCYWSQVEKADTAANI